MTDKTAKERAQEVYAHFERYYVAGPVADTMKNCLIRDYACAIEAAEAPLIARVKDLEVLLLIATEALEYVESGHSGCGQAVLNALAHLKAKEQSK